MDASEYKHVVLGLVFLKYIDDAFTERRTKLAADLEEEGITGEHADDLLESRDEYTAGRNLSIGGCRRSSRFGWPVG